MNLIKKSPHIILLPLSAAMLIKIRFVLRVSGTFCVRIALYVLILQKIGFVGNVIAYNLNKKKKSAVHITYQVKITNE